MSVNSTNRLTPLLNGNFWAFAIAPDNSYVYYIFNNIAEPQKTGLYKIPLFGGKPPRIKEKVGTFAISPDEKLLAAEISDKNTGKFHIDLISHHLTLMTEKNKTIPPNQALNFQ